MHAGQIEPLITVVAGLYLSLIGFGVLRASKNEHREREWREKYGVVMKTCGPLLVAIGLIRYFIFISG